MVREKFKSGVFYNADCFEVMEKIKDTSIDMILNDPPYATTAHLWDQPLDWVKLWTSFKKIRKQNSACVFTATQPFTTLLASSNLEELKYEWIWQKNRPTNFAHAKNKPMKKHENILVFSAGTTVHKTQSKDRMIYNPQGLVKKEVATKHVKRESELTDTFFSKRKSHGEFTREFTNYPHSILTFDTDKKGFHPTQKPVALFEYLINTYTDSGMVVLDNTAGSGTTAIAAMNAGRKWICIEKDPDYYAKAIQRIKEHEKTLNIQE